MDRNAFSGLRILLLADKTHAAATLRAVLGIAGVTRIVQVEESARALELLGTDHYDMLFCQDTSQPVNGLNIPLAVRRHKGVLNPLLPIFVFHERVRRSDVEKARDTGATDVITCPISPKTIMTKMEAALSHPRPFIKAPAFFGPDRRAAQRPAYQGAERRSRQPRRVKVQRAGQDDVVPL